MADHVMGRTIRTYISTKLDSPTESDWKKVGCSTSDGFTSGSNTNNQACKDTASDGVWEDAVPTSQNWSIAVDGMIAFDEAADVVDFDTLLGYKFDSVKLLVKQTSNIPNDVTITGTAYITNIQRGADVENKATYNIEITGAGKPTKTKVAVTP